jgi:hypothetical protein
MRRLVAALAVGAGVVATIGAQAQNLYVPLTSYPGDNTVLELIAVNPDPAVTRVFSGTILGEGANGATATGTATEQIGVAPNSTRVISGPAGVGLWRIKGFSGLQISARLRVPGGASQHQGDAVPILSGDNAIPANTTVETTSLLAASGYLSDVGLFNAGELPANCDARVLLADGTQVGPTFALLVAPLSFTLYERVPTGLVGGAQVSNARVTMRCDQRFFVLSRTVNPQTGYVSIHTASTAIARGLPDPGSTPTPTPPPPPPPPPGNSPPAATALESFARPGNFYTPSDAQPELLLQLPVTPNVAFSSLSIKFRLEHGGWNAANPEAVLNLAYLTRGDFTGDVFASITARGPNRNVVRNEITVDLPQGQMLSRSKPTILEPGKVYAFDYLYDWVAGTFTLTISDALGPYKVIAGPATGPVWTKNKIWTLLLSEAPREGHAPNLGWKYSDLLIEWRP